MKIKCPRCGQAFIPSQYNVHIIGPDIDVECPFTTCDYKYSGKFTSFVGDQLASRPQSAQDAAKMQRMARYIELNSSEYYKKRGLRHGTKKVRNIST